MGFPDLDFAKSLTSWPIKKSIKIPWSAEANFSRFHLFNSGGLGIPHGKTRRNVEFFSAWNSPRNLTCDIPSTYRNQTWQLAIPHQLQEDILETSLTSRVDCFTKPLLPWTPVSVKPDEVKTRRGENQVCSMVLFRKTRKSPTKKHGKTLVDPGGSWCFGALSNHQIPSITAYLHKSPRPRRSATPFLRLLLDQQVNLIPQAAGR